MNIEKTVSYSFVKPLKYHSPAIYSPVFNPPHQRSQQKIHFCCTDLLFNFSLLGVTILLTAPWL